MAEAMILAQLAFENNEVPVGAVITNIHGKIISQAHNMTKTLYDPTSHAEIMAIRSASSKLANNILSNCDIYVTLEPCSMCYFAISYARIRRIYFGAYSYEIDRNILVDYSKPHGVGTSNYKPEIYGGILEEENRNLLKLFKIMFKQIFKLTFYVLSYNISINLKFVMHILILADFEFYSFLSKFDILILF